MSSQERYIPGPFAAPAATKLGRDLWAFLLDEANIRAMEVATDLGAPAVAGIEEALLRRFGEDVLDDRIKQMIGHMTRQVMERRGFVVDQMEVRLNSVPFAKATRYRRADAYRVHVFRNSRDGRDLCMADSRTPRGLPDPGPGARWRLWRSFSTKLRANVGFGVDLDEVRAEIVSKGYVRTHLPRVLRRA
ncbi:MAG: hypothetical protein OXQ89_21145 [Rhodospirillaceae bacterium]|nr:hypothetical protein [Rhodospirillaceae bacterium]